MANSADPDQLASEEANWSGSTLFAKAGYIRVQQDKGKETYINRVSDLCSAVCSAVFPKANFKIFYLIVILLFSGTPMKLVHVCYE